MATSEWLREMRQAAGAGTAPTAAISRPRGGIEAPTTPTQAAGERPSAAAQNAPQSAPQRTRRAFTAPTNAARNYREMYGELFRFHERHNPPIVDDDGTYWAAVTDDLIETARKFDDDQFMTALLFCAFSELESEYKAMRQQATGAE